jgi:hypothetical protein
MPAEAPLFLMYTSGTTGRPKGCQHSIGGYLAYVTGTAKFVQDIHPEDVYWCITGDIRTNVHDNRIGRHLWKRHAIPRHWRELRAKRDALLNAPRMLDKRSAAVRFDGWRLIPLAAGGS